MPGGYDLKPTYFSTGPDKLFAIDYCPHRQPRATVLFAPPFAEELNRARQMISRQARLLASHGYRVVVLDLSGTGDSHGDFATASLDCWSRELCSVVTSFEFDRNTPVVLWALRFGSLLGLYAIQQHGLRVNQVVLWGPCVNGSTYMKELLRLRLLSSVLGNPSERESIADLQSSILAGNRLEIAGYELAPEFYKSVAELDMFALIEGFSGPVVWFEMVANREVGIPAHILKSIGGLNSRGCSISPVEVVGPKFWSTTEIAISNELAERTRQCLVGLNERIQTN